jgi:3'-phosphoadenosine 5'-phosphosulfate sulfotransferase (PAPS reductase)/FAD synthetase
VFFFTGEENVDLDYDHYIIAFSGGKDSVALYLNAREQGVPNHKIELIHHDIDGREGSSLMDWPVTPAYCRAFAKAFGIPIYFSWKQGGFEREMLRHNALTAPTILETPEGQKTIGGKTGKKGTRRKFPQVSPDLRVRWCSAYLKIDVGQKWVTHQERFVGKRVAVLSGERGEESACRAGYAEEEKDRADGGKRSVTRLRPIKNWTEAEVWAIMERWKVNPHPCYHLGWGRCSCAGCIFGSKNQWASLNVVNPMQFDGIYEYEVEFGTTIRRNGSIVDASRDGTPYAAITPERVRIALSYEYNEPIIVDNWVLPAGAFGDSAGPT